MAAQDCNVLGTAFPSLPVSCCQGQAVVCYGGRIIELKLRGLVKTSGGIPDLSKLDALTRLDLSYNGSIPDSLFKLRNLKYLYINDNSLKGIPDLFGNIPELIELNLGNNPFNSELPSSIGSLSKMQMLFASYASLKGPIPNLSGLSSCTFFDVSHNSLTGNFPVLNQASQLSSLYVNDNLLTGTLPDYISELRQLGVFELYKNRLSGEIPSSYAALSKSHGGQLGLFTFDRNYLQGSVPEFVYDVDYRTYGNNCFSKFEPNGVRPHDQSDGQIQTSAQRQRDDCDAFFGTTQVSKTTPNLSSTGSPTAISQTGTVVTNSDGVTSFISTSITSSVSSETVTMNGTVLVVQRKPTESSGEGAMPSNTGLPSNGSGGGSGSEGGVSIALISGGVAAVIVLIFAVGFYVFIIRMRKRLAADIPKGLRGSGGGDAEVGAGVAEETSQITQDPRDRSSLGDLGQSEEMDNVSVSTTARVLTVVKATALDSNVNMFSNLNAGSFRPSSNGKNDLEDASESELVLPPIQAAANFVRPKATYAPASMADEYLVPPAREVTKWSAAEVATFLESVGVGNWVVQTLKERGVNGYQLWVMTEERLRDLGVGRGGEVVMGVVDRLRERGVSPPEYQD
ncbi:hypothetical protein HDU97_002150 [Phlyctochytrium planicorne]|nr:hypothetical protein HDU97_002150 [Phlyctochytrium planicorne]